MKKYLFLLGFSIILGLAVSGAVFAKQTIPGYIFSDDAGWISLNCVNASSCQDIPYGISIAPDGKVSGYGYSQDAGWIHFNPSYGGVTMNDQQQLSGWAWSESIGWIYVDAVKISTLAQLQSQMTALQNNSTNATGSASLISIVRQFCFQIYGDGDARCSGI